MEGNSIQRLISLITDILIRYSTTSYSNSNNSITENHPIFRTNNNFNFSQHRRRGLITIDNKARMKARGMTTTLQNTRDPF